MEAILLTGFVAGCAALLGLFLVLNNAFLMSGPFSFIFAPLALAARGALLVVQTGWVFLTWLLGLRRKPLGARWATRREIRKMLHPDNPGWRIGPKMKLGLRQSYAHLAIEAKTRVGKSTKFAIPTLLESDMNFLVTDLANELFTRTAGCLKQRGYTIQVFHFDRPALSCRLNPLALWRDDADQLQNVFATIVGSSVSSGDSKSKIWDSSAIDLLSLFGAALAEFSRARGCDGYLTFRNVQFLLSNLGLPPDEGEKITHLDRFMARYLRHDPVRLALYKTVVSQLSSGHDGPWASAQFTAQAALKDLVRATPDFILSGNDFDYASLRRGKKSAVFLICNEADTDNYRLPINLILSAICERFMRESQDDETLRPVGILIEEAGNIYFPNLAKLAATLGKRHTSLAMIFQSMESQLENLYGREQAHTILNGGVNNFLYYRGLPASARDRVIRELGRKVEANPSTGAVRESDLMSSVELKHLGDGAVFLTTVARPVRIKNIPPYFKDKRLAALANLKPPKLPECAFQPSPLLTWDIALGRPTPPPVPEQEQEQSPKPDNRQENQTDA